VYAAVLVAIVAGIAGMPSTFRFAFGATTAGVCARASVQDSRGAVRAIRVLRMSLSFRRLSREIAGSSGVPAMLSWQYSSRSFEPGWAEAGSFDSMIAFAER